MELREGLPRNRGHRKVFVPRRAPQVLLSFSLTVCMKSSVMEDGAEEVLRGLSILGLYSVGRGAQFELCFRKISVVHVRQVGVSKMGARNAQEKDVADLSGVQRQPPSDSAREHREKGPLHEGAWRFNTPGT